MLTPNPTEEASTTSTGPGTGHCTRTSEGMDNSRKDLFQENVTHIRYLAKYNDLCPTVKDSEIRKFATTLKNFVRTLVL